MTDKVYQEFFCGECKHYIRVTINANLNHEFWFECPNCGHKHRRVFRDGQILENGRYKNEPIFELTIPKSACSKDPVTAKMKELKDHQRRDGVVIEEKRSPSAVQYFKDRWAEVAAREKGEV